MKHIIVQADDWGYSEAATRGIEQTYEYGIATSTTALVNHLDPKDRHMIRERIRRLENKSGLVKPKLGIGVHLTLTHGFPLSNKWKMKEFMRPYKGSNTPKEWTGSAWKKYFSTFEPEVIFDEFRLQIERGLHIFDFIDHIDTDQNIAAYEPISDVYEALAREYSLPVRAAGGLTEHAVYGGDFIANPQENKRLRAKGIATVEKNYYTFFQYTPDPVASFLHTLKYSEFSSQEYMFHPVFSEDAGTWGSKDVQILTDKEVIHYIRNNIELMTYSQVT